jgi:uncharacterized protein
VVNSKKSALKIGVKDLVYRPGEMRELSLDIPAPEKYGEAVAWVPEGAPLTLRLRLEGLHEGILASGELSVEAKAECVRCLDACELPVQVDFQELFAYSPSEADSYLVVDDSLDLEGIIRDAVVLDLPFQPVCSPECYGLDPQTGEKRTGPAPELEQPGIDPRWQELGKLLESDQTEAS